MKDNSLSLVNLLLNSKLTRCELGCTLRLSLEDLVLLKITPLVLLNALGTVQDDLYSVNIVKRELLENEYNLVEINRELPSYIEDLGDYIPIGMRSVIDNILEESFEFTFRDEIHLQFDDSESYQKCIYIFFRHDPFPALKALRSFLEVLYDYDSDFCEKFSHRAQFSFFRETLHFSASKFLKAVKYLTVFPFAKYINESVDEAPTSNPWLFRGKIKNYLSRRVMGTHSTKTTLLWWSWLQGVKRGCEYADEEYMYEAYVKHKMSLDCEPPINDDGFLKNFSKKVDQVTRGFTADEELFQISSAACYESPRSSGGALAYILSEYNDLRLNHIPSSIGHELIIMTEWKHRVVSHYGFRSPDIQYLVKQCQADPHINVMVHAVKEPLKVRMITKGNANAYWYSRFFQKAMWTHLQKFEVFECTGTPLTVDAIYRLNEKSSSLSNSFDITFDSYLSGDYSAATDKISITLTKIVMEAFLKKTRHFQDECGDILRRVIYEQIINYPPKTGIDNFKQRNGQLMGSTLSFPILCIVNAVSYWIALEDALEHREHCKKVEKLKFDDLPMLCNGDDILFKTNDLLHERWLNSIRNAGFTLSIGKNYRHRRYCTMNSQLFDVQHDRVKELFYFNVGLLTGQSKVGQSKMGQIKCLRDNYNSVMQGAQNKLRAHHRFVHYNKDMFPGSETNWFVSDKLGGLGFDLHPEVEPYVHVNSYQRCVISAIKKATGDGNCPSFGYVTKGGLGNIAVEKSHYYSSLKWRKSPYIPREGEHLVEKDIFMLNNTGFASEEKPIFLPFPRRLAEKSQPSKLINIINIRYDLWVCPDSKVDCSSNELSKEEENIYINLQYKSLVSEEVETYEFAGDRVQ
jgi:hypothetical protein